MNRYSFPASLALSVIGLLGLAGPGAAVELLRPSKLVLTPLGNLLVAEVGTADPVNVGATGEISILEIAKRVVALTGSKSPIVHVEAMVDDPRRREPDLARAKALGWAPKVPLAEGLARTAPWFREALATAAAAR